MAPILSREPHHEPNRIKRAPAPLVHAAAPEVRRALRRAYFTFRDAYQRAARLLRTGVRDVVFPEGAFPLERGVPADLRLPISGSGLRRPEAELECWPQGSKSLAVSRVSPGFGTYSAYILAAAEP